MKTVPIKGLPPIEKRPRCPNCGKILAPWTHEERERRELPSGNPMKSFGKGSSGELITSGGYEYVTVSKEFKGYRGYGAFDTLRCAAEFANAAYKAGYRLTRKS